MYEGFINCKGSFFCKPEEAYASNREGENKSDLGGKRVRNALMHKMQQYPVKKQKKADPKMGSFEGISTNTNQV